VRWTLLVPAKSLPEAKSRLRRAADPETGEEEHARLVLAIRADTMAAARSARNVARLLVVVDRPGAEHSATGDELLVQSVPGLNAALREAAEHAVARWPGDGLAAMVGDLPALRPEELADALDHAAHVPRGYVADAQGTGTTLLTARGVPLEPAFGEGSAARHGASATPLPAGPGLRHDVDTAGDLARALTLGVGPATLAATAARLLEVHPDSA
jgi:2-phospho-L-lactate/phosphoenolpyruvate guanylyltransferase